MVFLLFSPVFLVFGYTELRLFDWQLCYFFVVTYRFFVLNFVLISIVGLCNGGFGLVFWFGYLLIISDCRILHCAIPSWFKLPFLLLFLVFVL
jgi:hypothetical protein